MKPLLEITLLIKAQR